MLRRIAVSLAAVAAVVPLSACDFNATAACHDTGNGTVACSGTYVPATPPATPPAPTTSAPVPTTQAPPPVQPTTQAPTTQAPPPTTAAPAALTAAERFGWGDPVLADEFTGTRLDTGKWYAYDGPGHAGNGRRVAVLNTVQDGYLRQTGLANGDSAGMAMRYAQKYGRWEVRARSMPTGPTGSTYHPVLIAWPANDDWPAGAEYDFLENGAPGQKRAEAYLHYPNHQPRTQEHAVKDGVDLSQWHNFGFEWTPDHIAGFIDGVEWFRYSADGIANAPGPMQLTIQLDTFHGSGMQPAVFDVDWARAYKLG